MVVLDITAKLRELDLKIEAYNKLFTAYQIKPVPIVSTQASTLALANAGNTLTLGQITSNTPVTINNLSASAQTRNELSNLNTSISTLLTDLIKSAGDLGQSSQKVYHDNLELSEEDLYDIVGQLQKKQAYLTSQLYQIENAEGAQESESMFQALNQQKFWLYVLVVTAISMLVIQGTLNNERQYLLLAFALSALVFFYNAYRQILKTTMDWTVTGLMTLQNSLRELFVQM